MFFQPKIDQDNDFKKNCEAFIKEYSSPEVAFRNAARLGRLDVIRFLAPQINVNSKGTQSGDNALNVACHYNQTLAIKLLLELGVRPDTNAKGEFPNVAEKLGYHPPVTNQTRENKPIIINTFGLNGVGDFVYAIRAHQACRRRLPPNVPIKSIFMFLVAGDVTAAVLGATRGDISPNEIYKFDLDSGEKFNEDEALKKSFIFLIAKCVLKQDKTVSTFRAYRFIADKVPKLDNFIKSCRLFLNFGTPNTHYPQFDSQEKPEKCFSFLELGSPFESGDLPHILEPSINPPPYIKETELNIFKGDAGMMLDEALLDLMECVKPETLCVDDFKNKLLFSGIMHSKGHFLVGYIQHFSSLAAVIATHGKKFKDLRVLANIDLIQVHQLNQYPFNQFAVVNLFDSDGKKREYKNKEGNGELNLFPFKGLSSQDKRRYLMLANSTLCSGDNSFVESICVGKPFFWDIPHYKISAVSRLMAWCCENQLLHLAKLLYLNCFLSQPIFQGMISEEQLSKYSEFLDKYWNEIISEVSTLKKLIIDSANFNDYLERILIDPQCNPLELQQTNMTKPPRLSSYDPAIHDREISWLGNEPLDLILNIQDPQLLLSHTLKLQLKIIALFVLYIDTILDVVAQDNNKELNRIITRSPLIDLTQLLPIRDIFLLEHAKNKNADNCFELLSEEVIKRGQANTEVTCKKVLIDYINHIGLKNKKNYHNLIEALTKGEYVKALCLICNSPSSMKVKFAELLCLSKEHLVFDINKPFGQKGYAAIHYAAAQSDHEVFQLLIRHGANPKLEDVYHNSAEDLLAQRIALSNAR